MDSQQAQLALLESGHAYQVLQQRMQREMQVFNELIKWHTDAKQGERMRSKNTTVLLRNKLRLKIRLLD